MTIMTRQSAILLGSKTYYTGKPCKHGHLSLRVTKSRICSECRENRKEIYGDLDKERYSKKKSHILNKKKEYYINNKQEINRKAKKSHQERRVSRLQSQRKYYAKNKCDAYARAAKRRALIAGSIPAWFDREAVNMVYKMAKVWNCHVDHVVPINSDIVCGLHTWENLQLLPKEVNASKGNRAWPDMPDE